MKLRKLVHALTVGGQAAESAYTLSVTEVPQDYLYRLLPHAEHCFEISHEVFFSSIVFCRGDPAAIR